MPLEKKASKKAFEHNVKAEMDAHPDKRKQDLAIAYSVQRQAKKKKKMADGGDIKGVHAVVESHDPDRSGTFARKGTSKAGLSVRATHADSPYLGERQFNNHEEYDRANKLPKEESRRVLEESKKIKPKLQGLAEGGAVSAKTEKRPMPDQTTNSTMQKNENANKKELYDSDWTDNPTVKQSQGAGMKTTRIKHPKMVASDRLQVRLRDEEDDLQNSAAPASPDERPPEVDNEEGPNRQGKSPEKQTAISTGKQVMAKGGKVESSDYDDTDPNASTDSFKDDTPSEDEAAEMARHHNEEYQRQTSGNPDYSKPHSEDIDTYMYADGGEIEDGQPEPEQEDEEHDSIAAAVMARMERAKAQIASGNRDMDMAARFASGGEVDIDDNNNEEPNEYPPMNGDALDHNMNDAFSDMEQPEDSNETGDEREDDRSDPRDMVDSIRKKMKAKRSFSDN